MGSCMPYTTSPAGTARTTSAGINAGSVMGGLRSGRGASRGGRSGVGGQGRGARSRGAEGGRVDPRPLEVQVQRDLPGEAHAPVDLNRRPGIANGGLVGQTLGAAGGPVYPPD